MTDDADFIKLLVERNDSIVKLAQTVVAPIFDLRIESTKRDTISDADFRMEAIQKLEHAFRTYYSDFARSAHQCEYCSVPFFQIDAQVKCASQIYNAAKALISVLTPRIQREMDTKEIHAVRALALALVDYEFVEQQK